MKKQYQFKQLVPILIIVIVIILGIITNIATNSIPKLLVPYLWAAWPTLIVLSLIYLILQIWSQRNGESLFPSRGEKYADFAIDVASKPNHVPSTKSLLTKVAFTRMLKDFLLDIDVKQLSSLRYWFQIRDRWYILMVYRREYISYAKRSIIPVLDYYQEWQKSRNSVQNKLKNGIITKEVAKQAKLLIDNHFSQNKPSQ